MPKSLDIFRKLFKDGKKITSGILSLLKLNANSKHFGSLLLVVTVVCILVRIQPF